MLCTLRSCPYHSILSRKSKQKERLKRQQFRNSFAILSRSLPKKQPACSTLFTSFPAERSALHFHTVHVIPRRKVGSLVPHRSRHSPPKDRLFISAPFASFPAERSARLFRTVRVIPRRKIGSSFPQRSRRKKKRSTLSDTSLFGCPWQTRTVDTAVNSRMLYRLS